MLTSLAVMTAAKAEPPPRQKICIFSKHLQWLSISDAAKLAAEMGFDGIDITVRDGGHVLPERVSDDLPAAVQTIRNAGLEVPMITAGIIDAKSPHAEDVVKTIKELGIRYYRWGGFKYRDGVPIPQQISQLQARSRDLASLNSHYGVCAMYHTHSGEGLVGASIWDLYLILKDLDTNAVAVNYDPSHATIEGGLGGWIATAKLTIPMMRGIALKDFYWKKRMDGKWAVEWCPIGDGMVRFPEFFKLLRDGKFSGPVQLHFEYSALGGAEDGKRAISINRAEFTKYVTRDLSRVRALMRAAGLNA